MARRERIVILINVTTFLQSQSMIIDMMMAVEEAKGNLIDEEYKEGVLPEVSRKPGSGRVRAVVSNPQILESAIKFSESAGVSAHDRRRSDVGHFGFTMPALHEFIKNSCFPDNADQAPSMKTLRRLFEPPDSKHKASAYYKGDIKARPGTKKNDAPGSGEAHPHRHECSSVFKMSRYSISLIFLFPNFNLSIESLLLCLMMSSL